MNKIILFLASILCLFSEYSCSSESEAIQGEEQQGEDIILQERSGTLPKTQTLPFCVLKSGTKTNTSIRGNGDELLGYSYSVGNSILGDIENVKFPVLDIEKIKSKRPYYVICKQLNTSVIHSFAYNGISRYIANSQVTRIVKKGGSLNITFLKFKLFNAGRSKLTADIFRSSSSAVDSMVYGELNMEVRNNQFELLTTSDKLKAYASSYLSPSFQTDLYRGTIGNLIGVYGTHVLRSYITGGKAFALYASRSQYQTSSESRERGMRLNMNASFSWNADSVSGSLLFGKSDSSRNSTMSELNATNTEVYIRTFGGDAITQTVTNPLKLSEISLDLSAWFNSLRNKDLHTIIGITESDSPEGRGLYPLSDFVQEKNFKIRIEDTSEGLLESYSDTRYPRVEIVKVFARTATNGDELYEIAAVLNTRQGDKIVLSDGTYAKESEDALRTNNNNQTMKSKVQEIFAQKKTIFQGLQFSTNYSTTYKPYMRTPLSLRLDGFNENEMALYINPRTNVCYVFNSAKKIALSYRIDEEYEDAVLDDYGIRDWVESLPKKNISMMLLQNYTIIGL